MVHNTYSRRPQYRTRLNVNITSTDRRRGHSFFAHEFPMNRFTPVANFIKRFVLLFLVTDIPNEITVFAIGLVTTYSFCVILDNLYTRVIAPSQNFIWQLMLSLRLRGRQFILPSALGEIRYYQFFLGGVAFRFCLRVDPPSSDEDDDDDHSIE